MDASNNSSGRLFSIAALVFVTVLLSLPTVHYGYLLEEYKYIRAYSFGEILETFSSHWEPTREETRGYRPLHSAQHAFFHLLIGGRPSPNHVLQIGLRTGVVLLLFVLTLRAAGNRRTAFWTALIYPCLGTTAWQTAWLPQRSHLLILIFILGGLICYDRYLETKSKSSWGGFFLLFIGGLLLKEDALIFPLLAWSYSVIVRKQHWLAPVSSLLPLLAFILIFLAIRSRVISTLPEGNVFPPPPPLTPGEFIREYSLSALGITLQTGVRDFNDFPVYEKGIKDSYEFLLAGAVTVFLLLGGCLLFQDGTGGEKRTFIFGLAFTLISALMVTAWYRTDRFYLGAAGMAIILGTCVARSFPVVRAFQPRRTGILGALIMFLFLVIISLNLRTYFHILDTLHPGGRLARTWIDWVYDEYQPWMRTEQLLILRDRLRQLDRQEEAATILPAGDTQP